MRRMIAMLRISGERQKTGSLPLTAHRWRAQRRPGAAHTSTCFASVAWRLTESIPLLQLAALA